MQRPQSARLAVVTALVLGLHGLLGWQLPEVRIGEGDADTRPRRITVDFVRQLAPSPPATSAAPRPPTARARPAGQPPSALTAASAPDADLPADAEPVMVSAPIIPDAVVAKAEAPAPAPAPASTPAPAVGVPPPALPADPQALAPSASAALPAPAAAASSPAVDWPPSTRISYRLSGNYRGPVEGQAQVDWLRSGSRYQVFMDLSIGPSFAPLMSRRVSSEGEVTGQGLAPRRYDEETKIVMLPPRRVAVDMDATTVHLSNGTQAPRPPGLQDSASQFVQLTWLFTTQPELLQVGRSIVLPLALPRTVEPWTYDVVGSETLATPAGPVLAVHVKPRREPKPGVDLTAEIWVAPSLQYLPVRILIRQDSQTWIDLVVDRLPQQAAPGK